MAQRQAERRHGAGVGGTKSAGTDGCGGATTNGGEGAGHDRSTVGGTVIGSGGGA